MRTFHFVVLALALSSVAVAQERRARPAKQEGERPAPAAPRPAAPATKHDAQPKQEPLPSAVSLDSARVLFRTADANQDGKLDIKESASAGLGPRDCTAGDGDADKLLGPDEFLVSYCGMLTRLGRPVAADFQSEASRVSATAAKQAPAAPAAGGAPPAGAAPAPAPATPTPTPAPAPVRQAPAAAPEAAGNPAAGAAAQAELERKIEEALRKAESEPTAAPRERQPASTDPNDPATQAKTDLNRRLRNAGVTPEQAAAERSALERRIANAEQKPVAPTPAPAAPAPNQGTPPAADVATGARRDLERRLETTGASEEQAAEARKKLDQRIANAQGQGTPPADGSSAAPAAGDKAEAARKKLDQRLDGTGASEEQAAEARKKLDQRIDNAKGGAKPASGGETPPAPTDGVEPDSALSPEERARVLREALEKRLKETNATPEQAAEARAKLEKRLQNTSGGAGKTPPAGGGQGGGERKKKRDGGN